MSAGASRGNGGHSGRRSGEAFWWALFSAGGVMAALFVPAFVIVTGFLLPTGDEAVAAERAAAFVQAVGWWPVKVALLGVITLSLFHCMHRVRHTLMDVGLRRYSGALKLPCYGGALAASVWAALVLWGI
ncbi:MAG: fumarate reductase subunit D [Gemmatimonadetes bacterium]|nr:fumarate reductase subunit D [Gemmatimonadota bacterium]